MPGDPYPLRRARSPVFSLAHLLYRRALDSLFEAQYGGQGNSIFAVPAAGGTATLLARGSASSLGTVSPRRSSTPMTPKARTTRCGACRFRPRMERSSENRIRSTVGRGRDWQAAVSRDGRLVAFTAMDRTFNLETVPFDAESGRVLGAPRPLTNSNQVIYFMCFSPDGHSVVFQASRGSGTHIWRVDSGRRAGAADRHSKFQDTTPQWSPDGSNTVAFLRSAPSTSPNVALWSMTADGVNPRELLSGLTSNLPPRLASRWLWHCL